MNEEPIKSIVARNSNYFESLMSEISIDNDIEGKGILNKNIDKLYKSKKYVKGVKHFEEIVTLCYVVIQKMNQLKESAWKTHELISGLLSGMEYYTNGNDCTVYEYHNKYPQFKSVDGHIVRSKSELIIDLWLCYQHIEHIYEPPIYKNKKRVAVSDFFLPEYNCYIEYWGLEGDSAYEKRKAEKIDLYKNLKLRLISIYPDDIKDLDHILEAIKSV